MTCHLTPAPTGSQAGPGRPAPSPTSTPILGLHDADAPTAGDISKWLAILHPTNHAIEIRAPKTAFPKTAGEANVVKRFAPGDFVKAAAEARKLSGNAPAVYFLLNGIAPTLPRSGRLSGGAKGENIPRRLRLLIDCDPTRPGTVNATDDEKREALKVLDAVRPFLYDRGFPSPAVADSGNGYHLIFALDLPNDTESTALVKAVLESLAAKFDTATAKIDTKVFDAPRLVKFYGTRACKGGDTPDRPGRYSRLLSAPSELDPIPTEMLRELAAEAPPTPSPAETGIGDRTPAEAGPTHRDTPRVWDAESRAVAYLAKCNPSIEGQNGSRDCFVAALKVGPGFDLPEDVAERILRDHYNPRCQPSWSDAELKHKVQDAYRVETRRGFLLNAPLDRPALRVVHAPAEPEIPVFEGPPGALTMDLLPVSALPAEMIPAPLRGWLSDVADRGCFPLEYPATSALVALSSLIGRSLTIRPKRHDAWTVIPNLWGAIVGPPGMQKTPAAEETFLPLRRLVAEATKAHALAEQQAGEDAAVAEAMAGAAKKRLSDAAKKGLSRDELRRLASEASSESAGPAPVPRRYIVNDATVEKLGELLRENPRGLLQFRDELSGWLKSMDRQGHESDRGFYLEAWNGNGAYTFDRIGRGTVHVNALCLSIFGTIQPGPLSRYLKGAAAGEDADGFVPRFQMLLYPDPPREFNNVDRWPDLDAKNRAFDVFRWIDTMDAASLGAEYDEDKELHFIRFDDDAQALFDEWRVDLENRVRGGAESTLLTCHLAKYRSLMPSLALLFHVIDRAGSDHLGRVSRSAAELAGAWCELLEQHAKRVYQSATEGDPEAASRLAERIKQSLSNPFSFRDVANKGWAGLDNVDDVRKAVGILEDRQWVKTVVRENINGKGGRPKEEVWINPLVRGEQGGKP